MSREGDIPAYFAIVESERIIDVVIRQQSPFRMSCKFACFLQVEHFPV